MPKLIAAFISATLLLPSFSWALSDSYTINLVEKAVASIESSKDLQQQLGLAAELKDLVIQRADQIGNASLTNKSYDAESSELTDLIVALDRATLKKGTKAECARSLNGLLTDAGVEKLEEIEAQPWNQQQASLLGKLSASETVAFRILKAICE